jgi:agmatine/peptidylarginine deiminase
MLRNLLTTLLLATTFSASGQYDDHRMNPGEKNLIPTYMQSRAGVSVSTQTITPPITPVRTIGEWEELQGLLVAWTSYTSIIREIIRAARTETTVYVLCTNPTSVYGSLLSNGIDTSNVECLTTPFNSVWSRDYGPWSAYTNEVDTLITIDWIYNRPRPNDDQAPVNIATITGTPLYQTTTAPWNLVHTGGNFMTDGAGTGFSSILVNSENSSAGGFGINHTPSVVDTIMYRFMGINRYIKMTALPYDVIHHIDMHMKLLDEETILMGEYPPGVSDGPQIEANLQYVLNNFMSCYGTPYKVIRIPMPADGTLYPNNGGDYFTYTNSSFINNTIIVPTYNIPSDTVALRIYREALPGYTVTGINSTASIGALGALHCITKEIGTSDPLLIRHQALVNTTDTMNDYLVQAYIRHRSGIQDATLYWTTDTTAGYATVPMTLISGNQYNANIPAQPAGTSVYYYVGALAVSGKSQVRPMPAPSGYWKFNVTGVTTVAEISFKDELKSIYPNPSRGITCIPLQLKIGGTITASLTDISGRDLATIYNGYKAAGEQNIFVDTSTLSSGVYILSVSTPSGIFKRSLAVR